MTVPPTETHYLPAVHALELAQVARGFGVSVDELLAESGFSAQQLAQPGSRVPLAVAEKLVTRAIALTGQPGIGLLLGYRMRVPTHGYLGFAAMTAPTVRHALELAVRYAPTRSTVIALRLEEGEPTTLFIDELCDLGGARDTLLFALVVGLWRIGETLTQKQLVGTADLAFARPSYAPPLAGSPFQVHYGCPHNCVRFARSYLDLPLSMAEPSASLLAQEQCERALEALDKAGLLERVRSALVRPEGGVCNVDEVAAQLGTSTRTLHRKLKAEGVVFSELADAVQHRQACLLLQDESLSVEAVAERVGYANVSNFARAFRRWTGTSPAAYRKSVTR